MRMYLGIAAILALAASGSAKAAITVLGSGEAQACYRAALSGKADADAITSCDVALETEPLDKKDRGGTLINRGVLKLQRRQYDAARSDFDAGIALIPTTGEGWIDRGATYVAQKRYQEGLDDLDKGISLGPKEPAKAYFNRALAHEGLDDEKSAYLDYQQALALKPGWDLPQKELLRFTVTRR